MCTGHGAAPLVQDCVCPGHVCVHSQARASLAEGVLVAELTAAPGAHGSLGCPAQLTRDLVTPSVPHPRALTQDLTKGALVAATPCTGPAEVAAAPFPLARPPRAGLGLFCWEDSVLSVTSTPTPCSDRTAQWCFSALGAEYALEGTLSGRECGGRRGSAVRSLVRCGKGRFSWSVALCMEGTRRKQRPAFHLCGQEAPCPSRGRISVCAQRSWQTWQRSRCCCFSRLARCPQRPLPCRTGVPTDLASRPVLQPSWAHTYRVLLGQLSTRPHSSTGRRRAPPVVLPTAVPVQPSHGQRVSGPVGIPAGH